MRQKLLASVNDETELAALCRRFIELDNHFEERFSFIAAQSLKIKDEHEKKFQEIWTLIENQCIALGMVGDEIKCRDINKKHLGFNRGLGVLYVENCE